MIARVLMLAALLAAVPASARDLYLLMGQSNMSGRGNLADLPPSPADRHITLYGNDGRWRTAREPLDDPTGQVDAVSVDPDAAAGPGLPFARAMRRATRRDSGLVPCAKGGSPIRAWAPAPGRDTLYGSCLARAREASRKGHVAGILWYQGETDAARPADAAAWRAAFEAMITQARADLEQPALPVVLVTLADPPESGRYAGSYPAWGDIQRAQASVALCNAATVPTAELERGPDRLHLTTAAQQILGQRLAVAMLPLVSDGAARRC